MIGMVSGNLRTTGSMNGKICLTGAKLFFKKRLGNFEATAETRANLVGHRNSFTTGLICQNQLIHCFLGLLDLRTHRLHDGLCTHGLFSRADTIDD